MGAPPPLLPAAWSAAREATDGGVDVIDDDVSVTPKKEKKTNKISPIRECKLRERGGPVQHLSAAAHSASLLTSAQQLFQTTLHQTRLPKAHNSKNVPVTYNTLNIHHYMACTRKSSCTQSSEP